MLRQCKQLHLFGVLTVLACKPGWPGTPSPSYYTGFQLVIPLTLPTGVSCPRTAWAINSSTFKTILTGKLMPQSCRLNMSSLRFPFSESQPANPGVPNLQPTLEAPTCKSSHHLKTLPWCGPKVTNTPPSRAWWCMPVSQRQAGRSLRPDLST